MMMKTGDNQDEWDSLDDDDDSALDLPGVALLFLGGLCLPLWQPASNVQETGWAPPPPPSEGTGNV